MMSSPLAPNEETVKLRPLFEDLLFFESDLISNHQLDRWTELLHDDIRYWIPVRSNRESGAEDLNRQYHFCHIDDDKQTLEMRAKRVTQGFSYADNPLPRIRHFVTNVRVVGTDGSCVEVTSNVMVWRSHVGLADHLLVGCRHDRWVQEKKRWLLAERKVLLDHDSIPGIGVML